MLDQILWKNVWILECNIPTTYIAVLQNIPKYLYFSQYTNKKSKSKAMHYKTWLTRTVMITFPFLLVVIFTEF